MVEDWMKCCKYCRYFKEGYCCKDSFVVEVENNIDTIIEEGLISESIREGFLEKQFDSVGKTKKKEFAKELETAVNSWVEDIDESISTMLRNNFNYEYGFKPKDASSFCCNQWN